LEKAFQNYAWTFGPGYRVYFIKHGGLYVVLLAGGEKSSQASDITKALALARGL